MRSSDMLGTNLDVGCMANLCERRKKYYIVCIYLFICIEYTYFFAHTKNFYQRIAIFIGVVRHDVNISAGRLGFIGKI